MATGLVNLKRALEKQIIPNRNRYAVGSEERAKFDDLLSRLRKAENESEFNKVNNDFKTLTGHSDLVDIDSLTSAASEEFVEPVSIETEQETELQKLDAATEELENLRVSAGQTTNPEELRNIQERAQSIYNSAFSTFSRNDDNDTLEQIASEHLETINSNLEIAQATQKFDEQTAEIEDLRVKAMNTSDARELNDIRDRAQSIYTQNFPNNSNNESEQVFSDIAREHVEQISELARTAESIAANAVEEEEIQPQNIDYDNPLSESIETNDTPSAPASPTDVEPEPEIFMGSIDSDAFDLDEVVQDEPEVVIDNNAPTAESIETNDTPSAPASPTDAPAEPEIFMGSIDSDAFDLDEVVQDEPEVVIDNNEPTAESIEINDTPSAPSTPVEPETTSKEVHSFENDEFEIGIGDLDFDSDEYVPIEQLEDLYKKAKKATTLNEVLELSDKAHKIREQMEKDNFDKKYKDKATELDVKISSEVSRLKSELNKQLENLSQLENKVGKVNTVEEAQNIYEEAAHIRDKYFDIKDVPKSFKDIADKHVDNIYNRYVNLRNERDNGKGMVNDSFEIGIGENDFENEEEVIDAPDIEKDFKEVFGKEKSDKVKITIYNGKHQETFLIPRGTSFKEPLPAIPVNKNGKPKKLTAKEFDGWLDEYGNEMEFPVVINDDFEIHASYKFDKKKALAVAAGAAVGGLAYVADLALPTPVPVISTVGSIGFKLGARAVNKKLANIQKLTNEDRKFTAQKIQDIQEPSPELLTRLETEKSLGHWKTFLNTAAIACGISAAAHGIKNTMDAKTQIIEEPVQPEPIVNEPIVQEPIVQEPIIQEPIIQPESQQVLGEFDPTIGKVYKTANSALSGTGAGNPYMPAYQGQEIYQAFFNGNRVMIQPGQSIESILQSVGASDISEVAVNVMNANGSSLTWQPLEALVEGISQVR